MSKLGFSLGRKPETAAFKLAAKLHFWPIEAIYVRNVELTAKLKRRAWMLVAVAYVDNAGWIISGLVYPGNALLAGSRDMHSNWHAVWVTFGDYTLKLNVNHA
jgi:hypothetical protein